MSNDSKQVRVIVTGAAGRMGQEILGVIEDTPDISAVGAIEYEGHPSVGQPVGGGEPLLLGDDIKIVLGAADVIIDFTTIESTLAMIEQASKAGVPCVIGTTGFSPEQKDIVATQAKFIPILMAPNMSIGVNLMLELIKQAAGHLDEDYDIEIVEMHHNKKKDAPSGTAMHMAEVAAEARKTNLQESGEFSRHGIIGERKRGNIGVQTLRGGDVVGDHTIIFAGAGERLEISHKAQSRQTFAKGAVRAARWIVDQKPGLYSMTDVLG